MPHGPAHRTQKKKNIVLTLILLALVVLLFVITLMRMGFNPG